MILFLLLFVFEWTKKKKHDVKCAAWDSVTLMQRSLTTWSTLSGGSIKGGFMVFSGVLHVQQEPRRRRPRFLSTQIQNYNICWGFFFPSLKSSVKFMHLNVIIHIFYRIGLFIWAIIFWLHYPKWLDLCLVVLVCSGQRGGAVSWTVDRRRSRMDEGRSLCGDVGPQRCGLVYCVGLGTVAVTTSDLWNKNPFVLWTGLDAYLEYGIRSCLHSESGVFHSPNVVDLPPPRSLEKPNYVPKSPVRIWVHRLQKNEQIFSNISPYKSSSLKKESYFLGPRLLLFWNYFFLECCVKIWVIVESHY